MSSPIVLPPSNDQHALVNAIRQAATTDRTLLLEPGIHYTAPGVLQMIPIGPQGLHIGSTNPLPFPIDPGAPSAAKTMIKRPDHSISQAAPNFNYGLFFIPSPPTKSEIAGAVWKPFQDSSGPFEFAVVMRGSVNIGGLLVDSNMGKQNLESAPEHAAEHSAMLGFSGFRYDAPAGPNGIKRHIYIGFQSITLQELTCFNGGYADDIWFPFAGGAFHPNIEQVLIRRVISGRRLDPHRGTITFSALAKKIDIQDANIYQLHAESDADWNAAPRKDDTFTPSQWNLDQIQTQVLIFSVQGKVVQLNARRLTATTACQVELAGGKISDSHFTVQPGKSSRFFRLDRLSFENVAWLLKANDQGAVDVFSSGPVSTTPVSPRFTRTVSGCRGPPLPGN
jgi:hypothetical protein